MFASRSLIEHVARGLVGSSAAASMVVLAPSHPVWSLAALPVAFVAFRGCPMCWTVGLVQTIAAKLQGKPATAVCTDGRCALSNTEQSPGSTGVARYDRERNAADDRVAPVHALQRSLPRIVSD